MELTTILKIVILVALLVAVVTVNPIFLLIVLICGLIIYIAYLFQNSGIQKTSMLSQDRQLQEDSHHTKASNSEQPVQKTKHVSLNERIKQANASRVRAGIPGDPVEAQFQALRRIFRNGLGFAPVRHMRNVRPN